MADDDRAASRPGRAQTEPCAAPADPDCVDLADTARLRGSMRLLCIAGPDLGRAFDIGDTPLTIGRGEATIDLTGNDVSRLHARLLRDGDRLIIEDLGSANGTFVDGARVDAPVSVSLGARIQIGSTLLLFTWRDELEQRMLQIQKLEAMAAVIAGLTHDFNNLIMIMLTGLEALECNAGTSSPAVLQTLSDLKLAGATGAALVRRLLAFGRRDPGTREHFSVQGLVEDTLALARRVLARKVQVSTAVAEDAWLSACRDELQQVLLNVVLNARDAMPTGGRLDIEASVVDIAPAEANIEHVHAPGKYVQLVIRDTGVGMSEATLVRAFAPFFSTKAPGRGTGLGLASAYTIVRQHRGMISAVSRLGEGTVIRILLPAANPHGGLR